MKSLLRSGKYFDTQCRRFTRSLKEYFKLDFLSRICSLNYETHVAWMFTSNSQAVILLLFIDLTSNLAIKYLQFQLHGYLRLLKVWGFVFFSLLSIGVEEKTLVWKQINNIEYYCQISRHSIFFINLLLSTYL